MFLTYDALEELRWLADRSCVDLRRAAKDLKEGRLDEDVRQELLYDAEACPLLSQQLFTTYKQDDFVRSLLECIEDVDDSDLYPSSTPSSADLSDDESLG